VIAQLELVPLGVPAKIIVIIEQQDARPRRSPRPVKLRSRQSADPGTHDHQVVTLTGIDTPRYPSPIT
jgi:hypothetical protein